MIDLFTNWRNGSMTRIIHRRRNLVVLVYIVLSISSSLMAQQKGQYQPGEYGLNAGVLPDPGITYANFNLNYSAGRLNFANGNPVNATGSYDVWAVSNIFFYVPKFKILGAKFAPFVAFPTKFGLALAACRRLDWVRLHGAHWQVHSRRYKQYRFRLLG
jgi:hypothetical protein